MLGTPLPADLRSPPAALGRAKNPSGSPSALIIDVTKCSSSLVPRISPRPSRFPADGLNRCEDVCERGYFFALAGFTSAAGSFQPAPA